MSQSLGNFITVSDYLKIHSANSLRILFWTVPFDHSMDISNDVLEHATVLDKRIEDFINTIRFNLKIFKDVKHKSIITENTEEVVKYINQIELLLHDGFKINEVIGVFNCFITTTNIILKKKECDVTLLEQIYQFTLKLLYIMGYTIKDEFDEGSDKKFLDELVVLREIIKKEKMYKMSDYIRDKMFPKLGYSLQDTPDGSKVCPA